MSTGSCITFMNKTLKKSFLTNELITPSFTVFRQIIQAQQPLHLSSHNSRRAQPYSGHVEKITRNGTRLTSSASLNSSWTSKWNAERTNS